MFCVSTEAWLEAICQAEILLCLALPPKKTKTHTKPQKTQQTRHSYLDTHGRKLEQGRCTPGEADQVRKYLSKVDLHKSMSPNEMHPQVLSELAGVIVRLFLIILYWSW